jgi:peptidyl-prolyl cis-trans isomerase A (cyclophilin A)
MKRREMLALAGGLPLLAQEKNLRVVVKIETELGEVLVALSGDHAPKTVENFLRYVDAGLYDGGVFHRSVKPDNQPQSPVKIEVIQGGPNPEKKQSFPPIELERTKLTGLKHVNGVISMARSGPDTATGDFFFCIGDQPELDFGGKRNPDEQGFAAFGMALKGLEVIRKIQQSPVTAQKLTPPVKILRIARVD